MATKTMQLSIFSIITMIILLCHFSFQVLAQSYCGGPCNSLDDCSGDLICVGGQCDDDPEVGTHFCDYTGGGGGIGGDAGRPCQQSGTLKCKGKSFPKFKCSPPVSSSTPALLTLNDFSEGGDGGGASECDEKFHSNKERVVALSTGWYSGGSRCGKMIRITAKNGRSTLAKVVDECDSMNGCDAEHAGQPPCRNNIVDGSAAVWKDLGLDEDIGVVPVTWSMA